MAKVSPFLWFVGNMQEAVDFYVATFGRYLSDKDRARAARVMQAMLGMKKIVIADLEEAYAG
jgi:predicted 3-demethylubiquinone-9 3-methyltransferase (glyoxalase superfamily)